MCLEKFCLVLGLLVIAKNGDVSAFLRLPKTAEPVHYAIKIRPDMDNKIFYGEVRLNLKVHDIMSSIILHGKNLNISECYLNQRPARCKQQDGGILTVNIENGPIEVGAHILKIRYTAKLKEGTSAFSKDSVEDWPNLRYIYVTDLEPSNAREVFPCFDEPSFKAKFGIRLIAPNDSYNAISNMQRINKFKTGEGVVYDFATSVKMSTYLVSFAFTNLPVYKELLEDGDRSIPIRIHAVNASAANNAHAANCTKNAITFYSEYTGIKYPLSKLDMIEYRRPETAATENWGLITFRQGLLSLALNIYDENQIKLVIYHELSHFWFGNLVTNDWWNDLWLQEGFATYMSYKLYAQETNISQVKVMKSFQYDRLFDKETFKSTIAVVSHLAVHDDIIKKFDSLVYDKGAGILLMLEEVIGAEAFQDIIRTYLKRYAYATASTDDFIGIVEERVPNMNLRGFIESYIYQNKFPMISISESNGTYYLKQQVCETTKNANSPGEHLWTIPVSYITDNDVKPKTVWLDRDMDILEIQEPNAKWLIFNPEGKGMFKINLTAEIWEILVENFQHFDQDLAEQVVSDVFYAYRFNLIDCDIPIKFMEKTTNSKWWTLYFPFYDYLSCQLIQAKKKEEIDIFTKFLEKRFSETGFKRKVRLRITCDDFNEEYQDNEASNMSLQRCSAWIKNHMLQNWLTTTAR